MNKYIRLKEELETIGTGKMKCFGNSMLPILGNTEQVTNNQGGSEEFDDATKVNEYASWYLSGVNNKAEYGENTDDRVVNYSGPVQKLIKVQRQAGNRPARSRTAKNSRKTRPVPWYLSTHCYQICSDTRLISLPARFHGVAFED